MELDLQSLFGFLCTAVPYGGWAVLVPTGRETPQLPPTSPHIWAHI
jgi:hypothetical protein